MTREAERKRLVKILKENCHCINEDCEKCGSNGICFTHREANHLLDNGIIVPPVKVGDRVYWIDDGKIKNEEVFEISIHSDGILVHTGIQFCLAQVFLTREEAEKALRKEDEGK